MDDVVTMPPRAPSQSSIEEVDRATKSVAGTNKKAADELPTVPKGPFTFHWELNLYSFGALGIFYYFTPDTHRLFWHVIFALIAIDAAKYYYCRGSLAGVPYTLPFVSLLAMIIQPNRFWSEMAYIAMNSEGVCSNTLVGNFMVFVTDPAVCREILQGPGDGTYSIYAHPNALWLFGPKNLIYLEPERHKKFRAILTPALFSEEALSFYAQAQERAVRRFMEHFAHNEPTIDAMFRFRSMAAASSQESFIGPYLTENMRSHLEEDILTFTMGFLSLPFPYAFGLKRAIRAKERIETTIRELVPLARQYIQAGNEPRCLLEYWSVAILQAAKELECDPQEVDGCHDDDMARTVLDFLFAAQDATNSGLVYALDVLDAHRDVLAKMRAEVDAVCGRNGAVAPKRGDLPYTAKVANQLLHHKPPVPMIPHLSSVSTTIKGHSIPKGTVCIPSIMYSGRVNGSSMEFLPERPDQDSQFVKTITFGGGQHKCPGRRYAETLMMVFLSIFAQGYDVARTGPRSTADEFVYFPTIFPKDSTFVISKR